MTINNLVQDSRNENLKQGEKMTNGTLRELENHYRVKIPSNNHGCILPKDHYVKTGTIFEVIAEKLDNPIRLNYYWTTLKEPFIRDVVNENRPNRGEDSFICFIDEDAVNVQYLHIIKELGNINKRYALNHIGITEKAAIEALENIVKIESCSPPWL